MKNLIKKLKIPYQENKYGIKIPKLIQLLSTYGISVYFCGDNLKNDCISLYLENTELNETLNIDDKSILMPKNLDIDSRRYIASLIFSYCILNGSINYLIISSNLEITETSKTKDNYSFDEVKLLARTILISDKELLKFLKGIIFEDDEEYNIINMIAEKFYVPREIAKKRLEDLKLKPFVKKIMLN